jgi:hypothetical protein
MDEQKLPGIPSREDTMRTIGETMDQARAVALNATDQVWSAASTVGTAAQNLAVQAREQTSMATEMLHQRGARAGEYLTRNVNAYPLTALMLAAMVGYGTAYLLHRNWQRTDRLHPAA